MPAPIKYGADMVGAVFGRLAVLEWLGAADWRHSSFRCRCVCGKEKVVAGYKLSSGNTKSCGCLVRDADVYRNVSKRLDPVQVASRHAFYVYRRNARHRKIPFTLSVDDIATLIRQPCTYCGRGPLIRSKEPRWAAVKVNGVDRVDNSAGYEAGNVVPCCFECNRAKAQMTVKKYREFIGLVNEHFNRKEEK